jgi:hypothetical protein
MPDPRFLLRCSHCAATFLETRQLVAHRRTCPSLRPAVVAERAERPGAHPHAGRSASPLH